MLAAWLLVFFVINEYFNTGRRAKKAVVDPELRDLHASVWEARADLLREQQEQHKRTTDEITFLVSTFCASPSHALELVDEVREVLENDPPWLAFNLRKRLADALDKMQ